MTIDQIPLRSKINVNRKSFNVLVVLKPSNGGTKTRPVEAGMKKEFSESQKFHHQLFIVILFFVLL